MSFPRAPIVVFGTGGSGTRAIAELLRQAGVYMGPKLNGAGDSLVLKPFVRRWPERYLAQSGWVELMSDPPTQAADPAVAAPPVEPGSAPEVPPPDPAMRADLLAVLSEQREGIPAPDAPWGWKNPRTIYLLPALDQALPGFACVQLVRDGRDMAYSKNQQQVEAYGELLVPELASASDPVRSIALWSRINLAAARYGHAQMRGRHLLVRYEDLCGDPRAAARLVLEHLGIDPSAELLESAAELVKPSGQSGRWREAEAGEAAELTAAGAPGLREFGYAEA